MPWKEYLAHRLKAEEYQSPPKEWGDLSEQHAQHQAAVQEALDAGEAVPNNVLSEYPRLATEESGETPMPGGAQAAPPPAPGGWKNHSLKDYGLEEAKRKLAEFQKSDPALEFRLSEPRAAPGGRNYYFVQSRPKSAPNTNAPRRSRSSLLPRPRPARCLHRRRRLRHRLQPCTLPKT